MKFVLSASILAVLAGDCQSAATTLLRARPSSSSSNADQVLNDQMRAAAASVHEEKKQDEKKIDDHSPAPRQNYHQQRKLAAIPGCPGEESFDMTFSKKCNYVSLRDKLNSIKSSSCTATGDEILLSLLGTTNQTLAEDTLVPALCADAYANTAETFPFSSISQKGKQFDNEYYSGGSYWNYEIQTDDGRNVLKDDAARVKRIFDHEAQHKIFDLPTYLPAFDPHQDGCDLNAAFCCWVQDRQAGDNNGNCNTPYESQCIDRDPADNTNFCYTDHSRSSAATHVDGGFSIFTDVVGGAQNIEGSVHCHGFAWGQGEDDISGVYKGNNLFFVSMYDHMHQRGYVRNAPGSTMCGCAENMAVVTRADCTEIAVSERFTFSYDATTAVLSGVLIEVRDINYNSCQGANNNNNDLEAYYHRLVNEGRQTQENLDSLREILVGTGNCNTAVEAFLADKGIVRPPSTGALAGDAEAPPVAGIAETDESKEAIVEAIDPAYEGSEGGGGAMPDVPTDLTAGGDAIVEDDTPTDPPVPVDTGIGIGLEPVEPAASPVVEEKPLLSEGEACEHGWDCMSGKCLGSGVCARIPAGGPGSGAAGGGMCVQEGDPCKNGNECCDGKCGGKPKVCGGASTAKGQ